MLIRAGAKRCRSGSDKLIVLIGVFSRSQIPDRLWEQKVKADHEVVVLKRDSFIGWQTTVSHVDLVGASLDNSQNASDNENDYTDPKQKRDVGTGQRVVPLHPLEIEFNFLCKIVSRQKLLE